MRSLGSAFNLRNPLVAAHRPFVGTIEPTIPYLGRCSPGGGLSSMFYMTTSWKQPALLIALALCAYLVPISTNGAWILLAPVAAICSYLAGRHVASWFHGLLAFGTGLLAAALTLILSSPVSLLTFALNILTGVVLFALLPWWIGRSRRVAYLFRAQERQHLVVQAQLRERARIAGSMHDQLGHDLALLALASGGLQVSLDKGSTAYTQAAKIREQADEAIDHLHQIIGVLHDDRARAPLEPADAGFERFIEQTRAKGMDIRFHQLGSLSAGSGASLVLQTVQEALTNAAKYAPHHVVDIELDTRSSPISLSVSNPLTGEIPSARHGATGLASLRASLEAQGGSLRVTRSKDRFELLAVIAQPEPSEPLPAEHRPANHRSRLTRILVPILAVAVIAATLLLLQDATYRATALPPAEFQNLTLGMSHEQVDQVVQAKGLDKPLPVIYETAPPAGAKCRYYAARSGLLDLGSDMFRLCYTEEELVSADRLYPNR